MPMPVYIDDILPRIEKAARYIGGEVGSVLKPIETVALHVGLCFPDIYEVAESYLGQKILYSQLNAQADVFAERVYAPWTDMAQALRELKRPLFGLESRTPLGDFDLLGFSLNHELAYTSVLNMLELGGLPLRATQRAEEHPLVIAGGPACSNPEPMAPFFDAIFLGDGEDGVVEIARRLIASKGQSRAARIEDLAAVDGVLLPQRYQPRYAGGILQGWDRDDDQPAKIPARKVADLDASPSAERWIAPHLHVVHDRAAVEIQRGCSRGCRFCQAGMIYRPTRQRSPKTVQRILRAAVTSSGSDQAGLLSLSAGDYPLIQPLLADLAKDMNAQRVSLSVPSLRTETLSPALAREVMAMRGGGFTLAPEAATQRLRQVIAKGNTEADLLNAVEAAVDAGASHLKLYFMIGLPTETDDDVKAIATLCEKMLAVGRNINKRVRVSASISTFVPKPHTPFQWEAQADREAIDHKHRLLHLAFRDSKVRARWHDVEMSLVEGIYARGDRRLADVLEAAFVAGAQLDAWGEHFNAQRHYDALTQQGLSLQDYLRPRALDEALPWDLVDYGLLGKFLRRERDDAYAAKQRGDCVDASCLACGVCDFDQRRVITYRAVKDQGVARVQNPLRHRSNHHLLLASGDELPIASAAPTVPANDDVEIVANSAEAVAVPRVHQESDLRPGQRPADVRVQSLRVKLSKHPPAIFLSHLETMAALQRACARARIPIAYSGGFSPRPRLSMPFALPVGARSDDEQLDIDLYAAMGASQALRALKDQLPRGIRVLDVVTVDAAAPRLGHILAGAIWKAELQIGPRLLEQAIARYIEAETWPLTRKRKKKVHEVDLKTLAMDFWPTGTHVQFRLYTPAQGSIKPVEALTSIFGEAAVQGLRLHKLQSLYTWDFADLTEASANSAEPEGMTDPSGSVG